MKYLFLVVITLVVSVNCNAQKKATTKAKKDSVYMRVEVPPMIDFDLNTYLSENLHYPETAIQANIEGRVIVNFIVTENGDIDAVRVVKGVHPDLDEEAMRVVRIMPKWKPGMTNGQAVNVYFNLPIVFKLTDK